MRRPIAVAAALFVSLPLAASAAAPARQKIAVLDVRSVQGVSPGTATILTAIVVDDTARGGYDVISQGDVAAMIGFEKQKRILGCGDDSSCLAEIGGALGVEFVLTGQVGQIGSRYHLSFQILDARKAKVVARSARFSDRNEDALANAAQACVGELLAAARAAAPAKLLPAPPPVVATPAAPAPAFAPPVFAPPPAAAPAPAPAPDLSARPAAAPPARPEAPAAPAARSRTGAWVAAGAAVAFVAGGAVFGLKAKKDRDDLAKAWAQPNYQSIYDSKSKSAKNAALVSNVCWAGAGVSAAVSGYLFWKSRSPAVAVAPAVGEDGRLALVAAGSF
jgi:TolB-like protein